MKIIPIKLLCRLYDEHEWKQAKVIGITISKQPEVDTYQIIRKAWEQGKTGGCSKMQSKAERTYHFELLTEFSQLESVFYGLLEPIEG